MSSAQGYKTSAETDSKASGVKNPAIGSGEREARTTSEDVGALPADFTLANTKHESKGEDLLVDRQMKGEGLQTAGPGGDPVTKGDFEAHEIDLPPRSDEQGPHRVADPKNQGAGVF